MNSFVSCCILLHPPDVAPGEVAHDVQMVDAAEAMVSPKKSPECQAHLEGYLSLNSSNLVEGMNE